MFSKEHDDFSPLYWIPKLYKNPHKGNNTTGAYSFCRKYFFINMSNILTNDSNTYTKILCIFEWFQYNVFILFLRRTSHLNKCSYLEIRCFQSYSMNECSQFLPITVLRNTHSKILCNLELFHKNVFIFLFRTYTQPILINIATIVFESGFN